MLFQKIGCVVQHSSEACAINPHENPSFVSFVTIHIFTIRLKVTKVNTGGDFLHNRSISNDWIGEKLKKDAHTSCFQEIWALQMLLLIQDRLYQSLSGDQVGEQTSAQRTAQRFFAGICRAKTNHIAAAR